MYLSYQEIEAIADAVLADFDAFFYQDDWEKEQLHATPIDQFAQQYLGLNVRIERLCSDESICGVTAYADTELLTEINGTKVSLPLRQGEVLLDVHFLQPGNVQRLCGKRRFTLAHECAHQLLYALAADEQKAACRRWYTDQPAYFRNIRASHSDSVGEAWICRRKQPYKRGVHDT